ncbi:MHYT domain-containing protein [Planosporangium sp. 12N6]|uniref:MHYT domain-containing protein n=1 Tax=Planosporangium spinosum TaxID=3402278 RepID=UPI003CEC80B7
MSEVHHFAYGWTSPTLAYVMSFLGSLLGLILAARAREVEGAARARWLALAAVAIGGTGIWLMHFMAMIGFDVPDTVVRYDVPTTVVSVVIAVVIVGIGLFIVGMGSPRSSKLLIGGPITGIGVAAMHYTGMAAMRLGGVMSFDPVRVTASVVIAIVAATAALWFALYIRRGGAATVTAALLMGLAVSSMHYTGMSAIRVTLTSQPTAITGVSALALLLPISILACVVVTALAYVTVGLSMRKDGQRADRVADRERADRVADRGRAGRAAAGDVTDRAPVRIPVQATGSYAGDQRTVVLPRLPNGRHR